MILKGHHGVGYYIPPLIRPYELNRLLFLLQNSFVTTDRVSNHKHLDINFALLIEPMIWTSSELVSPSILNTLLFSFMCFRIFKRDDWASE
jgi:hypothetical protein